MFDLARLYLQYANETKHELLFSDKKNIEGYSLKEKKKALIYAEKAKRYFSFYLAVVG